MVLDSRIYIAFGSSMRYKREAYSRAMHLLAIMGIGMDSFCLDRYYSSQSFMGKLGDTKGFVIPRNSATLNGSQKLKDTMKEFVVDTKNLLKKYHQRRNLESGYAGDKNMIGWKVA